MNFIHETISSDPTVWESLQGDCCWVILENAASALPSHPAIHGLDWKLGGAISRLLQSDSQPRTFVSTQGKTHVPLLAVEMGLALDMKSFLETALQMGFKRVLLLAEREARSKAIEREWARSSQKGPDFSILDSPETSSVKPQ